MNWLIVERYENWRADKANNFSFFGVPKRKVKLAQEIKKGDTLITYVSLGFSSFADLREVTSDSLIDIHEKHQYDDIFQSGIATRAIEVLDEDNWVPIKEGLLDSLSITKGKKNWGNTMYNPIKKLSEDDAALLISSILTRVKK